MILMKGPGRGYSVDLPLESSSNITRMTVQCRGLTGVRGFVMVTQTGLSKPFESLEVVGLPLL